jgi:pimeloyl-ACP methyl ester carboxylesterase
MLAQALVLARPDLVRSLTPIATASSFPEAVCDGMRKRAETARAGGMAAVLQSTLERWFTPETSARRPDIMDRVSKTLLAANPAVHAAVWEMIAAFDTHDRLKEITCPGLILVGDRDQSTPPSTASRNESKSAFSKPMTLPPRFGSRLTTWGVRSGLGYAECRWLDPARTNPPRYLLHGPRSAQGRDRRR